MAPACHAIVSCTGTRRISEGEDLVTVRTTSRRSSLAAGVLGLTIVLVGCGSSADTPEDPDASESGAPSTTTTPSETSTPTVAPATGPEIAVRGLRANAPEGWEAKRPYAVMSAAVPVGSIGTTVYVFRFPNSGLLTLDGLARASSRESGWTSRMKRLDDVDLDGQPAFHLAGKVNPGEYLERFGAILNDDRLTLTFEFLNGEDEATRDEIIASVLPTVDFRELTG
jgi:hypothetical protein